MSRRVHTVDADGALQETLDGAAPGDVVSLGPGRYRGPFVVRATISLVGRVGLDAGAAVVLEGDGVERVLAVEPDDPDVPAQVTLSGLTIRGGVSGLGAGVALLGTSDFEAVGCVFEDNRALDVGGGAFFASGGRIHFRDCVFRGNAGLRGGALLLSDVALASATNCLFQSNEATRGGALRLAGGAVLAALHCTFADDRAVAGESGPAAACEIDLAGAPAGAPRLRLANSLVLATAGDSLADAASHPAHVVVSSSVVPPDWREAAHDLVIEGETAFVAAPRGGRPGAPTVAPGGPGAADWTLTLLGDALLDMTGSHRLADGRVDVGAVEAD